MLAATQGDMHRESDIAGPLQPSCHQDRVVLVEILEGLMPNHSLCLRYVDNVSWMRHTLHTVQSLISNSLTFMLMASSWKLFIIFPFLVLKLIVQIALSLTYSHLKRGSCVM